MRTPRIPLSAPLYAFFTGTPDEILRQADLAESRGYTVAKVKISSFEEGHFLLKALQHRFTLRIDCNMAFSLDEAVSLFSPYTFEFIEDPTYELGRLAEFPLPFAIDEPLHLLQPWPSLRASHLETHSPRRQTRLRPLRRVCEKTSSQSHLQSRLRKWTRTLTNPFPRPRIQSIT